MIGEAVLYGNLILTVVGERLPLGNVEIAVNGLYNPYYHNAAAAVAACRGLRTAAAAAAGTGVAVFGGS